MTGGCAGKDIRLGIPISAGVARRPSCRMSVLRRSNGLTQPPGKEAQHRLFGGQHDAPN